MIADPLSSPQADFALSGKPRRTPEEQQLHTQTKALKKRRKVERLLFFFGWCEGCRAFSNSF